MGTSSPQTYSRTRYTPSYPPLPSIDARGGAPGRLQTSVDENKIYFGGMLSRLREQNYRGSIAIEYVWTDWERCIQTDNVSETTLLCRLLEN